MTTRPTRATCPDWCTTSTEEQHWENGPDLMPWVATHTRTFGALVVVQVGHEVHDDNLESWATPTLAIDPDEVELQNGPSMLWTDEAAALAGHLQAATAFALALEAATALRIPEVAL